MIVCDIHSKSNQETIINQNLKKKIKFIYNQQNKFILLQIPKKQNFDNQFGIFIKANEIRNQINLGQCSKIF